MKKLFTLIAFVMLAIVLMPQQSKATHLAGGEISYSPTGVPNQYLVKLLLFRDCLGITMDASYDICFQSTICGLDGTILVSQVSVDSVGASPCAASSASCPGSLGDIEIYRYEGILDLPAQCSDWMLSWDGNARNNAITTLQNPGGLDLFLNASLDNTLAAANSSPVFTNIGYTRFCVGNEFNYPQGAVDPDGDSLVFSLVDALSGGLGACPQTPNTILYNNPFSGINPIASSTPITIDSETGLINFTPSAQAVAVICVLVEEYRNGIKIGEVRRDIQVRIVAQCLPIIPSFSAGTIGGSNVPGGPTGGSFKVNCNDRTIIFPLDTVYPIQCASAIPSDFRTLSPYGIPNPVVSVSPLNCTNGTTDTLVITFLNPFSVGITKLWAKKGFDGNTFLGQCGFELVDSQDTVYLYVDTTIVANLTPQPDSVGCVFNTFDIALSDSVYCYTINPDGSDFNVVDANGVSYPVASTYGYCTPNGLKTNRILVNMNGNVSGTGPYYVTISPAMLDGNTLADDCARFLFAGDTIGIYYVNNKIDVDLGTDQTVCGTTTSLPELDAHISGLQYQWFDASGTISGAASQTLQVNHTDQYIVQVNSGPSCQGRDTINVTFVTAPSDSLGSDVLQCINDGLPQFNAGNFGGSTTYQWYFNGFIIGGATTQQYTPTNTNSGNYSVLVSTGGGVCQNSYDVNFNTFNTFPVNTLANETICAGTPVTQLDAGAGAVAIGLQWFNGSTAIAGQTGQYYTPTTAGNYSVTVGTGSCASTSAMTLAINQTPTPTLNNQTLCDPNNIQALTVSGGDTYQWFFNSQPIVGATGNTYTPGLGAGTYSVEVTIAPGCTGTATSVLALNSGALFQLSDAAICEGSSTVIDPQYTFGTTYVWSTGATTQTITASTAGTYILTITENTCITTDSMTLTVNQYPVAPIVTCGSIAGNQYKFVYTWTAVNNAVSYEISEDGGQTWIAANGASGSTESHGTNNTVSDFLVRAIGSGNCSQGAPSVKTACEVVVHNVITPNGDSKNDFFKIDNIEQYSNNAVQIFNRWGKEVYSTDGYNNDDKKFTGKDVPEGTYFYIINLNQENKAPKSGTITIIATK